MDSQGLVLGRSRQERIPAYPSPGSLTEHSSSGRENVVKSRRKPIPRKGHTKSRKGCLNCKRRKVKCQETLPACSHCERLGLLCEYPSEKDVVVCPSKTSPSPERALQATPTQFTMDDLRLFHHFLLHAYPPLPLQGNAVWQEVSALSHNFDFLIHAMLGLAASHLSLGSAADYTSEALSHRVSAIGSLNKSLNKPCASKAEGEARFATCMALAFQSSYMPGGMLEFLCMIRGCMVVSTSAMPSFTESVFQTFSTEEHQQCLQDLNQDTPMKGIDHDVIDAAQASARALGPLCRGILEVKYLAILEGILKTAKLSDLNAVMGAAGAYTVFGEVSNTEFGLFTDPSNFTAQLIMIHFFVVEYYVGINPMKTVMDAFPFRRTIIECWILELERKLPTEYKEYIRWPMEFVQSPKEQLPRVVEIVDG